MAKEVLELSTESSAPVIKIDGVPYTMLDPGDMGAFPAKRMSRLASRWADLSNVDPFTEQHAAELDQIKHDVFATVLPGVPAEVAAKVKLGQKAAVAAVFFNALAEARPGQRQTQSEDAQRSSDSTAAPSANG